MSLDLRFERLIAARPERVFDAFTDPEGQREIYGRDAPGWVVESRCDRREAIARPRRILIASTETRRDGSSFQTTVEFTFEPRDGGTLMTMVQAGFPTEDLRDEHTVGLPNAFDRLARTLDDHGRR